MHMVHVKVLRYAHVIVVCHIKELCNCLAFM